MTERYSSIWDMCPILIMLFINRVIKKYVFRKCWLISNFVLLLCRCKCFFHMPSYFTYILEQNLRRFFPIRLLFKKRYRIEQNRMLQSAYLDHICFSGWSIRCLSEVNLRDWEALIWCGGHTISIYVWTFVSKCPRVVRACELELVFKKHLWKVVPRSYSSYLILWSKVTNLYGNIRPWRFVLRISGVGRWHFLLGFTPDLRHFSYFDKTL